MTTRTLALATLSLASLLASSVALAAWVPEGQRVSQPGTYVGSKGEISDGNGGIIIA